MCGVCAGSVQVQCAGEHYHAIYEDMAWGECYGGYDISSQHASTRQHGAGVTKARAGPPVYHGDTWIQECNQQPTPLSKCCCLALFA